MMPNGKSSDNCIFEFLECFFVFEKFQLDELVSICNLKIIGTKPLEAVCTTKISDNAASIKLKSEKTGAKAPQYCVLSNPFEQNSMFFTPFQPKPRLNRSL